MAATGNECRERYWRESTAFGDNNSLELLLSCVDMLEYSRLGLWHHKSTHYLLVAPFLHLGRCHCLSLNSFSSDSPSDYGEGLGGRSGEYVYGKQLLFSPVV